MKVSNVRESMVSVAVQVEQTMREVCSLIYSPAAQLDDAAERGVALTDAQKVAIYQEVLGAIDARVRALMGWEAEPVCQEPECGGVRPRPEQVFAPSDSPVL